MKKQNILFFDNLVDFERKINREFKPYDINLMVMAGTLEDKHKNVDPEKGIPALRRQFNLIFLVLDGIHDFYVGPHYYPELRPHDLVIVPENMINAASKVSNCKGYCIHFKTEFLQPFVTGNISEQFPFFDYEAEHVIHLKPEESESVAQTFRDILREFDRFSYEKDYLLKNYINILLLRIREHYKSYVKVLNLHSPRSVKLANQFKHLVEKTFIAQRSVQYYADMLNISPKHLSDTVKSVTGKTPSELIQNRILLEIKVLLRSTDMTIAQIANELNFSDQSHIARFIKQQTGYTPLELRNKL